MQLVYLRCLQNKKARGDSPAFFILSRYSRTVILSLIKVSIYCDVDVFNKRVYVL